MSASRNGAGVGGGQMPLFLHLLGPINLLFLSFSLIKFVLYRIVFYCLRALKARCLKALDVLKVLAATEWGADSTVLLQLYRALVWSELDYGSNVYGSARKSYVKLLDIGV